MFEFGKQASRIFHIFYHSFMPGASPVFVSYSHKDAKWLERCRPFLRPLHREGLIDLWDDKRILGGDEWRNEIQQALQRAEVAVLLISQYFLDSDFILKHELPPSLQAAEERGLKVLWLPLGHCT
ncbi:MAG: toll/interleukin-1 receptor domain-containing protein, partial [Acidobacteriaceae bacterium]|nr:toll/interleukin-1 receptor domain-containing protein [Acidobacteriaceae bacterium]